ncbi:MAG TPA: hypothetical protein VEB21_11025 [Terriglobales bacterium]|nr:hypothetical protein [Terriglobales bacterium]
MKKAESARESASTRNGESSGAASTREYLRRQLEAHLIDFGYSSSRPTSGGPFVPEIRRVSPIRGRIAYGETVLRSDLDSPQCHERLVFFSQRRTRHRSSILFFIGVAEADYADLVALLQKLEIQSSTRGGHVQVVSIPSEERAAATQPKRRA